MDWGSNKLNNIILPTSGKISVLAVNSFGCYTYVNISVEVNRRNIVLYIIQYHNHFTIVGIFFK